MVKTVFTYLNLENNHIHQFLRYDKLTITSKTSNCKAMKKKLLNIEVGVGIYEFKFGLTREELIKAVGKPDEVENNDEDIEEEGKIEVWHYDEFELSVEFIESNDWRLSTIAVNSEDCTLENIPLVGKSINEISSLLDSLNIGEYDSEKLEDDEDDEHEILLLSVFDAGLSLWFEDGKLTEIQLEAIE